MNLWISLILRLSELPGNQAWQMEPSGRPGLRAEDPALYTRHKAWALLTLPAIWRPWRVGGIWNWNSHGERPPSANLGYQLGGILETPTPSSVRAAISGSGSPSHYIAVDRTVEMGIASTYCQLVSYRAAARGDVVWIARQLKRRFIIEFDSNQDNDYCAS